MDTITLTLSEYEDLVDIRDAAIARREIAEGRQELLTSADVAAYLASPSPLAFWRERRGLTMPALAAAVDVPAEQLQALEDGGRSDSLSLYAKLAKALRIRLEDIVPDDILPD